ncbi:hypothetical protein [Pinisolibacter aquiterrae]|uniref:hypothetical protein n=1 Tax=Pinisolibacter aquiterrae TaxID=2815579 RepID=UPI001C3E2CF0|nr:hypothetical protein [Pinisolibacter aquiterrae]MBV5266610.1 hypothetical protein [Pinisolibacter aquiterrae]MCC8235984.1 hypothetical protein [Pinisolibacter aquiterrae]
MAVGRAPGRDDEIGTTVPPARRRARAALPSTLGRVGSGIVAALVLLAAIASASTNAGATNAACAAARPKDQCAIVDLIAPLPREVSVTMLDGRTELEVDESLIFEVRGVFRGETLYVGFVSAEGTVVGLYGEAIAGSGGPVTRRFGDGRPGAGDYYVKEPVGPEMLVALRIPGDAGALLEPRSMSADDFADRLREVLRTHPGAAGGYLLFSTLMRR